MATAASAIDLDTDLDLDQDLDTDRLHGTAWITHDRFREKGHEYFVISAGAAEPRRYKVVWPTGGEGHPVYTSRD